ncbi:MAG TPA: hypothetical protein VN903_36070 [Polyangia bacterium]|jgi:hypothetical protein|nr:hypothetical protein [Polyangia bacterium]
MTKTIAGIVALFCVIGCDSQPGPPDLSSTAKAHLADYCTKRKACSVEVNVPEGATCPTSTCLANLAEESALLEYFDCQDAKQCSAFFNDDNCVVSAGTFDAEREAFFARCNARAIACPLEDVNAYCVVGYPLFRKQWMHAVDACLGKACADLVPCLQAVGIMDCW